MDGRGMPAVFDGFVERWNRAVERELRRELAEGERKEKLLVVSRGEGDGRRLAEQARSVERIRKRLLLKDHIRLLPLEDVPDGLEWQTGMEEPDVGDPRAVKGGKVRLWINTPFPGTLRAFGPGSENFSITPPLTTCGFPSWGFIRKPSVPFRAWRTAGLCPQTEKPFLSSGSGSGLFGRTHRESAGFSVEHLPPYVRFCPGSVLDYPVPFHV